VCARARAAQGAQGRARRRNQLRAALALRTLWQQHNETVRARVEAQNALLSRLDRNESMRMQMARREGHESCGGKSKTNGKQARRSRSKG
jgi:hypothetical protein